MKIINNRIAIFIICIALLISSCSAPAQPADAPASDQEAEALEPTAGEQPTATPLPPTETSLPATDTPLPPTATFTPEPTATPAVTFTAKVPLGEERYTVEGGGFSFQVPADFKVFPKLYSAEIVGVIAGTVQIKLSGYPNEKNKSMDDLRDGKINPLLDALAAPEEIIEDVTASIDGVPAQKIITESTGEKPDTETIVIATPLDGKQVFAATLNTTDYMGQPATEEDIALRQDIFESILSSIQFHEIPASAYLPAFDLAACTVSTDDTYGLSDENPVPLPVYPDDSRVDEYFAMLRGPGGEQLQSELTGLSIKMSSEVNRVSHKYTVSSPDLAQPVVLYIWEREPTTADEIQQPLAPASFTCAQP